jgi:DNA mismatch endonuclease, patch repair protein
MADNMTVEQRRRTMSRIRHSNTKPELIIRRLLFARGLRYRKCCRALPGKPDLVFSAAKVAVFVDGDFWHGWRFHEWSHKLTSAYWKDKIARNRARDARNQALLEQAGWRVIRIWEHEVEGDPDACADKIEDVVRRAANSARAEDGALAPKCAAL